jgi:Arc/MetJ-type ribon-helix-helix transcriptional regulator
VEKNRIAIAMYFFICLIVISVATFWLVNYIKRWALISRERDITSQTQQDISEYQELGFADQTEVIQILQGRLQRAQGRIDAISRSWLVIQMHQKPNELTRRTLENIISINKKMLIGYIQDVKEYRKLGITNSHAVITFAHDKIIRLTIALDELERQLNAGVFSSHTEYIQRLARMHEISKQSVTQFKQELQEHMQAGLNNTDPKISFVRDQIVHKMRAMHQLEEILNAH